MVAGGDVYVYAEYSNFPWCDNAILGVLATMIPSGGSTRCEVENGSVELCMCHPAGFVTGAGHETREIVLRVRSAWTADSSSSCLKLLLPWHCLGDETNDVQAKTEIQGPEGAGAREALTMTKLGKRVI